MKSLLKFALLLTLTLLLGLNPAQALRAKAPRVMTPEQLQEVETEIFRLTNLERVRLGLAPLMPHRALTQSSREHSLEMARLNYFDHESPERRLAMPWDRVERAGFQTLWVAENLYEADGYTARELPGHVVRAWMLSPEHRANLLDTRNVFEGVGVYQIEGRVLVTQVFAGPQETAQAESGR